MLAENHMLIVSLTKVCLFYAYVTYVYIYNIMFYSFDVNASPSELILTKYWETTDLWEGVIACLRIYFKIITLGISQFIDSRFEECICLTLYLE